MKSKKEILVQIKKELRLMNSKLDALIFIVTEGANNLDDVVKAEIRQETTSEVRD